MTLLLRMLSGVGWAAWSLHALAQATPSPSSPPPAPPTYNSAFADYRPYQETKPADWRRINDAVRAAAAKPATDHKAHHGEKKP